MEYAEQVGVAANEYEPALPTAEAEDVHVDVDVEDKQPPPAGPSP